MADLSVLMPIAVGIGIFFAILMGLAALFKAFYIKVAQGTALIVNDMSSKPKVHFTGALVYPIIYKKEMMKISLITLEVDRRGKDGLICLDNMRADITVAFYLRVNETADDVLRVAKSIGADRASDKDAVYELFAAKFSEALKTVGKQIEFVQLFENRLQFREKIIEVIGDDLNGYVLEDVAIDYLEQTPKSALDPSNILDSEGIKKITQLTANQNVITNDLEQNEALAIKKKNVETREAMLELERQQADAEAKQEREVATIRAREEAETLKVQEEERKKYEATRIQVEQDLAVQTENQQREIEVAEQNRQRAVAIEQEKVTRARDLEIVSREREVELQKIEAEKAVEVEKKEIANVIRERVVVDKTVAIEEERIKEVREVSEADRAKQVQVLAAEAQADEEKVKQVKAAEAEDLSAKHKASEITIMAQANLEASAKEADAKKKLAEGIQAEEAASGLAEAKVQEAKADALEKEGLAEANVVAARGEAEGKALRDKGLADAEVVAAKGEAESKALRDTGLADAEVIAAKGSSEAKAQKEVGMAGADVTREQFKAEADGLVEKFDAMGSMSDKARDHEEFRMSLETAFKEAIASIEAGKEIAKDNADVLSTALQKAKIDIVGGEEHFFDTFAKSLSLGKAIDGLSTKSSTVSALLAKVMDGQGKGSTVEEER
ncbi:flotillin family protein [Alkalimarinus alittae]|uniref:Flotillin family protein n=1 Tax=Alkalimarinus alittae TaxID=2961619 RepID=A0ABY6N291_9ALTE|nr:flotillin family protein [Alkalimarinus alittae]UZE96196.1 flotillin family protein [Alkalimarinus alittae]